MNENKIKVLVVFLFLFFAFKVNAQVGEQRHDFTLGINGGVTMNNMNFLPSIRQKGLVAPTYGITFRYTSERYIKAYCALQAELNFTTLGWREEIFSKDSDQLPDTYERGLNYLQMPFLARLAWGKEKKGMQFFILAGPQLGYYLNEYTKKSEEWTYDVDGTLNRSGGVVAQYELVPQRKIDYGITAGLGLELNTPVGHFLLEGRYYYGLGDTFNNSKKDPFGRSAHGTYIIKTTYLFPIKK